MGLGAVRQSRKALAGWQGGLACTTHLFTLQESPGWGLMGTRERITLLAHSGALGQALPLSGP